MHSAVLVTCYKPSITYLPSWEPRLSCVCCMLYLDLSQGPRLARQCTALCQQAAASQAQCISHAAWMHQAELNWPPDAAKLCLFTQHGHRPALHLCCRGRNVALDCAKGLNYLHSNKLVHFDLVRPWPHPFCLLCLPTLLSTHTQLEGFCSCMASHLAPSLTMGVTLICRQITVKVSCAPAEI